MWLTDGFLVTFFGRWRGAVRIHMSHVQLTYTVINMQDGGGGGVWGAEHQKTQKVWKTSNLH